MSIQLNTENLNKSRDFFLEAWRATWENKQMLLKLAAFPIILATLLSVLKVSIITISLSSGVVPSEATAKIDAIETIANLFISVFFSIAWSRYLLETDYMPGLKSYFPFKRFFKYVLFSFAVIIPFLLLGLAYGFFVPSAFLPDLEFTAMDKTITVVMGIAFILGVYYVMTPIQLSMYNIALGKPFIRQMLKLPLQAKPYRRTLFLSLVLMCMPIFLPLLLITMLFIAIWLNPVYIAQHTSHIAIAIPLFFIAAVVYCWQTRFYTRSFRSLLMLTSFMPLMFILSLLVISLYIFTQTPNALGFLSGSMVYIIVAIGNILMQVYMFSWVALASTMTALYYKKYSLDAASTTVDTTESSYTE